MITEGRSFCLYIFGVILGLLIGIGSTYAMTTRAWRNESVAGGYAEYKVDDKGMVEWRWK